MRSYVLVILSVVSLLVLAGCGKAWLIPMPMAQETDACYSTSRSIWCHFNDPVAYHNADAIDMWLMVDLDKEITVLNVSDPSGVCGVLDWGAYPYYAPNVTYDETRNRRGEVFGSNTNFILRIQCAEDIQAGEPLIGRIDLEYLDHELRRERTASFSLNLSADRVVMFEEEVGNR